MARHTAAGVLAAWVMVGCPEPDELECTEFEEVFVWSDADGDGFGNTEAVGYVCAPGANQATNNADCDDEQPTVHPGAEEICDLLDNDCNNRIDETQPKTAWYEDADGDTYGSDTEVESACAAPGPTWIPVSGDCDDGNPDVNPAAREICNDEVDDDCDTPGRRRRRRCRSDHVHPVLPRRGRRRVRRRGRVRRPVQGAIGHDPRRAGLRRRPSGDQPGRAGDLQPGRRRLRRPDGRLRSGHRPRRPDRVLQRRRRRRLRRPGEPDPGLRVGPGDRRRQRRGLRRHEPGRLARPVVVPRPRRRRRSASGGAGRVPVSRPRRRPRSGRSGPRL